MAHAKGTKKASKSAQEDSGANLTMTFVCWIVCDALGRMDWSKGILAFQPKRYFLWWLQFICKHGQIIIRDSHEKKSFREANYFTPDNCWKLSGKI